MEAVHFAAVMHLIWSAPRLRLIEFIDAYLKSVSETERERGTPSRLHRL